MAMIWRYAGVVRHRSWDGSSSTYHTVNGDDLTENDTGDLEQHERTKILYVSMTPRRT